MPPRRWSRHTFALGVLEGEDTQLTDRVPYRFRNFRDNIQHVVGDGDSLFSLAARYFAPLARPSGLWWVIADFQPAPIHDPTIELTPGTTIFIPSLRTVQEEVFSEARREDSAV